jgi:YidC/Oxa1 family membrane protein insertase
LAALVWAARFSPGLAAAAVAFLGAADLPAAHRRFVAAMIRARRSGLRRRFFLAAFAGAGVAAAAALAFRTAAQRFLCAAVMRRRAVGRAMRSGASLRTNATVLSKPCGPVNSTRTPPCTAWPRRCPAGGGEANASGAAAVQPCAPRGRSLSRRFGLPQRRPALFHRRDDQRSPSGLRRRFFLAAFAGAGVAADLLSAHPLAIQASNGWAGRPAASTAASMRSRSLPVPAPCHNAMQVALMHDFGVRVVSTLLLSGVLLFVAFFLLSILYPRKVAASPANPAQVVSSRPKDYGYLAPLARPLEWTLRQVEARGTHRAGRSSWGWAIVLTTFLVNLVLLPFRILAARNAKAIKALQPKIDAINARYKRTGLNMDPEHSRKISEVYKQHKTSPLAGCIPALVPFAILIAFYSVLRGIAELHGAHWLWIADLSKPEQLPVRILPLLMIATQLLVTKVTPSPAGADPRMARIMTLMPLVFGIVLYQQPSALMLYWVTSNLLQLAQQSWLGRRYA